MIVENIKINVNKLGKKQFEDIDSIHNLRKHSIYSMI
jgi:hypothetical protein